MSEKLALAYCRVSTNRQEEHGHSLNSQANLLIASAEAQGYRVEIVTETGSGRRATRPALASALSRLERGEAQALFAVDIDRLARSVKHLSELLDSAKRRKWRLVVSTADIDTATPNGELLLGLLAQFAQFESRMTGERVKRQHQARRDRGITWGVDQGFRGNLEPATRSLVASLSAQGYSLNAIARELTNRGLETPRGGLWHAQSVKAILNSPQTRLLAEVA
jgi:DNA invertase Pin-like site-specific DNA recombinase